MSTGPKPQVNDDGVEQRQLELFDALAEVKAVETSWWSEVTEVRRALDVVIADMDKLSDWLNTILAKMNEGVAVP